MRVALVIDSLRFGGAQKCTLELCDAFNEAGIDADLITYREEKSFNLKNIKNHKIIYIPGLSKKFYIDYVDRFLNRVFGRVYGFILSYLYSFFFKRQVSLERYDSIFFISDSGFFPFHSLKHRKVFFIAHSYKSIQYLSKRITKDINKFIMQRVFKNKKIICITSDIANDLKDTFKVKQEDLYIIPNIIDAEDIRKSSKIEVQEFNLLHEQPYLVHVGRHSSEKRIQDLIKCFAKISYTYPDLTLVLIGEGPETQKLKELSRVLNISKKIRFMGFISNPYPYISKSEMLVLCSEREGLPTVVIESLLLKKVALCSKLSSGLDDIYGNIRNEYTFGISNIEQMKMKIEHFLAKKEVDISLYEHVQLKFSKKRIIESFTKLLND